MRFNQFVREMDSQGYSGSRDKKSHSKYGSRDDYELGGPETTLGPDSIAKPKDVAKQGLSILHKSLDRALSKEKKASPVQVEKNKARWAKRQAEKGVAEADQLPGTPVVSLSDLDSKDTKKNRYGQTVPKKLEKDDPRVKFHKEPEQKDVDEGYDKWGWHTSVTNGEFMPTKYGNKNYVYLHDLDNESPRGGAQLVTFNKPTHAKKAAQQFGGKVVKTDLNTYRVVKPAEQEVEEDISRRGILKGLAAAGASAIAPAFAKGGGGGHGGSGGHGSAGHGSSAHGSAGHGGGKGGSAGKPVSRFTPGHPYTPVVGHGGGTHSQQNEADKKEYIKFLTSYADAIRAGKMTPEMRKWLNAHPEVIEDLKRGKYGLTMGQLNADLLDIESRKNYHMMREETIHVGHRNSKGEWIKTSTHSNYADAKKAMADLEKQGKKGVQHRYDNKRNIDPGTHNFRKVDEQGVAEGAGNIGNQIKSLYQKIYDQGDDAIEFMYYDSPIFAQYWDEYEGDLNSIIAEVDPGDLQIILDELTSAAEDQGIGEAYTVTRGIDQERYQPRRGLEGPFSTKSGKVVYYDKVEGKYYDPDTDMYIEYDDWRAMNEGGSALSQAVREAGWGRSSWDTNMPDWQRREQDAWDSDKRAFKRAELQHELGHEDDPNFERNLRQQQIDRDRGPWYLRIDGKVYRQKGQAKSFDWKRGANNYALAMIKNNPSLQGKIMLTKSAEDK